MVKTQGSKQVIGTITSKSIVPDTDNTYDIGSSSFKFKDGYFAGKLTVGGGVDPTYIQFEPQAGGGGIPNNSLYVDSSDSYKLKLKDNGGLTYQVSKASFIDGNILDAGDGSDGVFNSVGNGTFTRGQVYQYTSFTLNSGHTYTPTGGTTDQPVIILVQGDCQIDGIMNFRGYGLAGGAGSAVTANGNAGTGITNLVGGGAGGIQSGTGSTRYNSGGGGGAGGKSSGIKGGDAVSNPGGAGGVRGYIAMLNYGKTLVVGAGGGSGGVGSNSGNAIPQPGGAGGGALIIIVGGDFTLSGSGIIDCSGEDGSTAGTGSPSFNMIGGAGGGGGGSVVIIAAGNITLSGTIDVTGGVGSNGIDYFGQGGTVGNGGAGGEGTIIVQRRL